MKTYDDGNILSFKPHMIEWSAAKHNGVLHIHKEIVGFVLCRCFSEWTNRHTLRNGAKGSTYHMSVSVPQIYTRCEHDELKFRFLQFWQRWRSSIQSNDESLGRKSSINTNCVCWRRSVPFALHDLYGMVVWYVEMRGLPRQSGLFRIATTNNWRWRIWFIKRQNCDHIFQCLTIMNVMFCLFCCAFIPIWWSSHVCKFQSFFISIIQYGLCVRVSSLSIVRVVIIYENLTCHLTSAEVLVANGSNILVASEKNVICNITSYFHLPKQGRAFAFR